LGVTLVLKQGRTELEHYVTRVLALFQSPVFRCGFKEIVV
jgi:hypothetical protein